MRQLKFLLLIVISVFSSTLISVAQIPNNDVEVGVVEHLGETIPLDLTFFNENGDTVKLADIIKKPTIFSFVYFDCPGLCSPLLDGVSDVVSKVDMDLGEDYQIITISFNTKDTPEKAREKKKNFVQKISQKNRESWMYLTGTQENINTITDALGFKYKPAGLDFNHPSLIIAVSPKGVITRYLYGLTFLPFDMKMAIIEAQKGIQGASVNKILQVCFAYNPVSRTYTLKTTAFIGGTTLGILLILLTFLLIKGRKKTNN